MSARANVGIRRILDHDALVFQSRRSRHRRGRERDHRREMVDDRVGEEANGQLYDHCTSAAINRIVSYFFRATPMRNKTAKWTKRHSRIGENKWIIFGSTEVVAHIRSFGVHIIHAILFILFTYFIRLYHERYYILRKSWHVQRIRIHVYFYSQSLILRFALIHWFALSVTISKRVYRYVNLLFAYRDWKYLRRHLLSKYPGRRIAR